MLRAIALVVVVVCLLPLASVAASPASQQTGRSQPVSLDRVKASGWLGERVDRAYRAVQNVRSSIWWNLGSEWGWEHAARWLRNMSYFAAYTGDQDPALKEDAERFLTMSASGELKYDYKKLQIGAYEDSETLQGLLAYYELSGDRRILDVAKRVGRNIAEQRHLTTHYYKPLAVGPLLKLSALSGDASFKKVAIGIAEEKQLEFLTMKAHGAAAAMIAECYLDLYSVTGNQRYLDWALKAWPAIRDRAFVTGGLGEVLDFAADPAESDVMCESCQVSRWMVFNLRLWQVTGDMKYMDVAERILYNQFAQSQAHRGEGGGFYAGGNIDQAMRGVHNYFCCDNEGTFGLIQVLRHIYTQNPAKKTVDVNLFFDSEVTLGVGKQQVKLRQKTEYPERGVVNVSIDPQTAATFTVRVRIPGWTQVSETLVNGKQIDSTVTGSYLTVARKWKPGDKLSVIFPMPMHVEADNTGRGLPSGAVSINGKIQQAKRVGVFYGPVLSVMFRTGHGNDLSWVWTGDYTDVLDSGGDATLKYPTSKSDVLELDGKTFDSGSVPEITTVTCAKGVPEISWDSSLGDRVQVKHTVRVMPGLPVTLECKDEVTGWDGKGRLLCSGTRFATTKSASSGYGVCSMPYPMPMVTVKPDLDNHIVWGGVFGLYERLANDASMPVTGTYFLNNGYFSAICLYDPQPVNSIVCKQTDMYAGLYMEPKTSDDLTLTRRLVFPLLDRPQNQTMAKQRMEKAAQVTAKLDDKSGVLVLTGPVVQGSQIRIPKSLGLQAGSVISSDRIASEVFDHDRENVLVYVDVPGKYAIKR